MTRQSRLGFIGLVLALSVLSAYVCIVAFVATQQLTLPRTDPAYSQSLGTMLSHPYFLTVAGTVAAAVGLVAFPIALFCLWRRDLLRCGFFVVGLTILFIVGATILAPRVALRGALVVALAALLFCRFSHLEFFQPRGAQGAVGETTAVAHHDRTRRLATAISLGVAAGLLTWLIVLVVTRPHSVIFPTFPLWQAMLGVVVGAAVGVLVFRVARQVSLLGLTAAVLSLVGVLVARWALFDIAVAQRVVPDLWIK